MIWFLSSFVLTAFGQPAWMRGLGPMAAAFGFALFWKGMLFIPDQKRRFWAACIWFSAVQAVQLSWMTSLEYMGPLILGVYLFLIFGMGIQFALLSQLVNAEMSWHRILAISGLWVIFEWSRLFFLCGFTWNPVGLALADSIYSLQLASIWGVFGLSFWVIFVNLMALQALFKRGVKEISLWAAFALLPYGFGVALQAYIEKSVPFSGKFNVALVQTALFPEEKDHFFPGVRKFVSAKEQWERILALLDKEKSVDLIVLPEAALPFGAHGAVYDYDTVKTYFHPDILPPLKEPFAVFDEGKWKVSNVFLLQALANQTQAHVIAGLEDADTAGRYNAAFHFSPKTLHYERYEKRVLAPIAEYIPLKNCRPLTQFIGKKFGIYSSFDPGIEAKIFHTDCKVGISICLEETFSNLTRELRLKGAEMFVNLTNDVWFPSSKLPRQHFDHGRIRAVENGVPILRACNTGVTGGVDCLGRLIDSLPISETKAESLYFTLPMRSYPTLYTLWGDAAILIFSTISFASYFFRAGIKSCRK